MPKKAEPKKRKKVAPLTKPEVTKPKRKKKHSEEGGGDEDNSSTTTSKT